jgi:transposase InsO family protein
VTLCRELNVSKAGFYAWRGRKPSDARKADVELLKCIRRIHKRSRGEFGRIRILDGLRKMGIRTSRKRIARLMRGAEIKGKKRFRSLASTNPAGSLPAAPNVLNRNFNVPHRNTAWVTDITTLSTKEGRLYLAVVIDLYSRRVVGYSLDKYVDAALALNALKMGLRKRPFDSLLVHSDRGSQFASQEYSQFLVNCGITPSMSRKGNCWDNAVAESFFSSLKVETRPETTWSTRAQAQAVVTDYIENWYNPKRPHSHNGYLSPIDFEKRNVT